MYKYIIKPLLFALNVEHAHTLAVALLRIVGCLPGGRWLLRKLYAVERPELEREVYGLHFRNPIGLAAGFDRSAEVCEELAALGFGFVEVGTVTPQPEPGNKRQRIFRLPDDHAFIHRVGRANKGLEHAITNLRRDREGLVVGCNIGHNLGTPPSRAANDCLKCFRNLYQYVDYFTVNVNYNAEWTEFAPKSREEVLALLNPLFEFRRGQNQYRPILMKISPDLDDEEVDLLTDIMIDTPLDGIVATNASATRENMRSPRAEITACGMGTVSGEPLTRRSIEIVRRIVERSKGTYPIIGSGGMMSAQDVRDMLAVGASLVQVYSGFVYGGPGFAGDICRDLIQNSEFKIQN